MRCNCECGYCPHHHGDKADIMDALPCANLADGTIRMDYVGVVCADCATVAEATGGGDYIHREV